MRITHYTTKHGTPEIKWVELHATLKTNPQYFKTQIPKFKQQTEAFIFGVSAKGELFTKNNQGTHWLGAWSGLVSFSMGTADENLSPMDRILREQSRLKGYVNHYTLSAYFDTGHNIGLALHAGTQGEIAQLHTLMTNKFIVRDREVVQPAPPAPRLPRPPKPPKIKREKLPLPHIHYKGPTPRELWGGIINRILRKDTVDQSDVPSPAYERFRALAYEPETLPAVVAFCHGKSGIWFWTFFQHPKVGSKDYCFLTNITTANWKGYGPQIRVAMPAAFLSTNYFEIRSAVSLKSMQEFIVCKPKELVWSMRLLWRVDKNASAIVALKTDRGLIPITLPAMETVQLNYIRDALNHWHKGSPPYAEAIYCDPIKQEKLLFEGEAAHFTFLANSSAGELPAPASSPTPYDEGKPTAL